MAKVSAFKGWRYNHEIIDDLKNVIVPPYDVITQKSKINTMMLHLIITFGLI